VVRARQHRGLQTGLRNKGCPVFGPPPETLVNPVPERLSGRGRGRKESAARWAIDHVPAQWQPLIEKAIAARPNPWQRVKTSADPELTARTAVGSLR